MNTRKDKAGRTSLARAKKVLTSDELFFFENAGWSYEPKKESAQAGRIRCAKDLAHAEQVAEQLNWSYLWDWDNDDYQGSLGDHEYWCNLEARGVSHEHEILWCQLRDAEDNVLESLGGIIDPDTQYRRVIEAELADEALSHLNAMRISAFAEPL